MEETNKVEKSQSRSPSHPPRGVPPRHVKPRSYPVEMRLKAVRLHVQDGFSLALIAQEMGVGKNSISNWVRRYREHGEEGLKSGTPYPGSRRSQLSLSVQQQIVLLKQQQPGFGVRKISQWLRRVLFLPASAETVRRTLHANQLMDAPRRKPKRNPPKPRFFERATPNQLWQSDIFTFRLGGKNAYLIGFIDDHARYIVGLDLFRSQTAEHVLEVYRTAVGEYGVPKEMLTDNGRQYASWRGVTRFEQELKKDRVHHLRSQPHHPMTLGKIERFWKTIWEDFLERAQFDSFDEARERVRLWVKFYNHRRPHQSLEGMCPADRFFAIAQELRTVIERGIAENVQELALRGRPREPFYLVGRMGEQSVVLRAEKGQLKMSIEGEQTTNEVTYPWKGESHEQRSQSEEGTSQPQRAGTGGSGAVDLDRAATAERSGQRDGSQQHHDQPVATTGAGGNAAGVGAAQPPRVAVGTAVESEAGEVADPRDASVGGQNAAARKTADGIAGTEARDPAQREVTALLPESPPDANAPECGTTPGTSTSAGRVDPASTQRPVERASGGGPDERQPQDLLQMGTPRAGGDDPRVECEGGRTPTEPERPREGNAPTPEPATPAATAGPGADDRDPPPVGGA